MFDIIVDDLLHVIKESRHNECILAAFNTTLITLIPKTYHVKRMDDLRPIYLCNAIYKRITKVFSSRLKVILSNLISPKQFSFLEGRQIHDVVGITKKILHSAKTIHTPIVIIKEGLSKAYDKVNWTFLHLVLL